MPSLGLNEYFITFENILAISPRVKGNTSKRSRYEGMYNYSIKIITKSVMKDSQSRMMQHSEAKVELLKLYIEQYLNILSQTTYIGNINVYDMFCGEGIYEEIGKGSPIVILETIKDIYYSNKAKSNTGVKFNCHFNDIEIQKIEKLKVEIANRKLYYPEMGLLKYTETDYRNLLPIVTGEINLLKNGKAFVFIDPYGYKDIRISDIKSLMQSGKSEVLLFLPTQFMFRFENKGTPESLMEFINELMPVENWPISETGIDFIENLTEAFRKEMGDSYFTDSFIITRDKNQFFCLFFFTKHIYGFDRMLHAKWKIDEEEGRGWKHEENDLFSSMSKKANIFKFEQKLVDFLKTERTNHEVYEFTLRRGHLPTHSIDILKKKQKEGVLITLKSDGSVARKSSFYLNYNYWRDEPNKIKLKIG